MKKQFQFIWYLPLFILITTINSNAQVGIGTTTPVASAQLEVSSTTKGFLPPRMTQAQRDSITNPVPGLMIWCNNCGVSGELQVYNGIKWISLSVGTNTSDTVTICSQVWRVKNLDTDKYSNGDPIPKVTDPADWAALTTGAYCYYNNDSVTYASTYGKMYNWYAVNDPRGLAPAGWHIPNDAEWTTVETCLGGASVAGGAMKEAGTVHWLFPNASATNSSGFTGLPGGYRNNDGSFGNIVSFGSWWSATESSSSNAWYRSLRYYDGIIPKFDFNKQAGFSVRCLRD